MAALTPLMIMAQEVVWRLSPLAVVILSLLLIALFIWLDRRKKPAKAEIAALEVATPAAITPKVVTVQAPTVPAVSLSEPAVPAPVASIPLVETNQTLTMSEPAEPALPEATRTADVIHPAAEMPAAELPVDDLQIIEGIGPKIAGVLKLAGVNTFAQLAQMDPARITEILHAAGLRLADPHSWPEQARLAAAGDLEKLKDLQSHLKAGRIV